MTLWLCLFAHLGAMGLVGPDEPRYAAIARGMAQSGDWVTPRLFGNPWFEKPVLYYWAAGGCYRIFEGDEWPARLPSALAALAAALAIAWMGWKLTGRGAGYRALLLFPASVAGIGFSHAATPDMLFSGTLTLAMAAGASVLWRQDELEMRREKSESGEMPGGDLPALAWFGVWLGLATLAKGPAALILAGGSVGWWAVVSGRWRGAMRLAHPVAMASWGLVALPWYVLCAVRNPAFLKTFLLEHNFERYLTPVFQHRQPLWFFLPIVLLGLFPWTPLLGWSAKDSLASVGKGKWRKCAWVYVACWGIFPVLFFSASESKLPGYVLPGMPALALLAAMALGSVTEGEKAGRWRMGSVGAAWLATAALAPLWLLRIKLPAAPAEWIGGLAMHYALAAALAGAGITLLAWSGRSKQAFGAMCLTVALLVGAMDAYVLPRMDPYISARRAAEDAGKAAGIAGAPVETYGLKRDWSYQLNFYLGRELAEWEGQPLPEGGLMVFTNQAGVSRMRASMDSVTVVEEDSPEAILVRVAGTGDKGKQADGEH